MLVTVTNEEIINIFENELVFWRIDKLFKSSDKFSKQ